MTEKSSRCIVFQTCSSNHCDPNRLKNYKPLYMAIMSCPHGHANPHNFYVGNLPYLTKNLAVETHHMFYVRLHLRAYEKISNRSGSDQFHPRLFCIFFSFRNNTIDGFDKRKHENAESSHFVVKTSHTMGRKQAKPFVIMQCNC